MRLKNILFSNIYRDYTAVGLDVSDFSIKLAKLKKKGAGGVLESHNRISMPGGVIEEGKIKKEKELSELIKKTISEAKGKKIKTPFAVCSLPEQHAFIKLIQIPMMTMKEAEKAIKWEMESNIPFSLNEVYLDYHIFPPKDGSNHIDVLISAIPKNLVDQYLKVLNSAGVEPIAFEIESTAIIRSLIKRCFSPEPALIIDLGFARTSFIIFVGKSIRFTSSIPVSNFQMINDIAKETGLSFNDAQQLKIKAGLDASKEKGKIFNALVLSVNKIINKIDDCRNFYKEHRHKESKYPADITKIILCGGGANLNGLTQYLSSRLKIPVSLGNPWVNIISQIDNSKKINKTYLKKILAIPYQDSLAYATALGLAIRGSELNKN